MLDFNNLSASNLDAVAVTSEKFKNTIGNSTNFSSNIGEVLKDCDNTGNTWSSHFDQEFPVVTWALRNSYAVQQREKVYSNRGLCNVWKEGDQFMIATPGASVWSLDEPAGAAEECCWVPLDFDKCSGKAPLALLCLKDCENILESIMSNQLKVGSGAISPISSEGEALKKVKDTVARYSMAYFTMYTAMLGLGVDAPSVGNIIKPFNGIAAIMEDLSVFAADASEGILNAFKSVGCLLTFTRKPGDDIIIAIHPLGYQKLLEQITYGQFNNLPAGWRRTDDDRLFYQGIPVVSDPHMPIDLEDQVCEAWVLNGSNIGIFLGSNPMVTDEKFIRKTYATETKSDGCGTDCTYYYNYGAASTNNTKKLARIVNIGLDEVCVAGIQSVTKAVEPQTLAPKLAPNA